MTRSIFAYQLNDDPAIIDQISIKRKWMDETVNKHAYQCMPVSLANTLGWAISFPEDISFIWDGVCDTSDSHIQIIKGSKYCSSARANATVSFNTYLKITTDQDITTLVMPVPNEFNENFQCFTSLISTSFYKSALPVAWRVLKPNIEISIPAGTPVAVFIPISLSGLQNFEVFMKKSKYVFDFREILFMKKMSESGKFSGLYKKAQNYKGESIGSHEVKTIKLKTNKEN